jgi:hypothetical protein
VIQPSVTGAVGDTGLYRPICRPGEHADAILGVLGYSLGEVEALKRRGAAFGPTDRVMPVALR